MSHISATHDRGALEGRYRSVLRTYPARWRAQHGEELIGVMLDVAAHEGRTRASVTELLHLGLHGLTARANQVLSVIPRRRRDCLAAVGSIAGAALALVMIVLGELGRWFQQDSYTFTDEPFGPLTTPAGLVFLLTLAACLAQVAGRTGLARALHLITIAGCVVLAVVMKTTEPPIVVPLSVLVYFAITSVLVLLGNPTRSARLRQLVLVGAPILGVFLLLTSYLQGAGSAKTFWRPHGYSMILDGYALSLAAGALVIIASLIILAGTRVRPWACLVLVPLIALPLIRLFLMLGGDPTTGLIGIPFNAFYTVCVLATLISAWAAWKRPVITFPTTGETPARTP